LTNQVIIRQALSPQCFHNNVLTYTLLSESTLLVGTDKYQRDNDTKRGNRLRTANQKDVIDVWLLENRSGIIYRFCISSNGRVERSNYIVNA
jgi:hypothetical protein